MRFESSYYLYCLFLLPVVYLLVRWHFKRRRAYLEKVFGARLFPFLSSSVSYFKVRLVLVLQILALGFFLLALARPQVNGGEQQVKSQGIELIFAVDVSTSMLCEDVRPNRLEFAKKELMRLADLLPGHKIGVLAFAGNAFLMSPLTTDMGALKEYLESLSTTSVSSQGTVLETALKEAKEAFEKGGVQKDDTHRVTRAVVIATDGEDHEEGALKQGEEMAKEGIHIFTIAFGTEKGGPIPDRDASGYMRGYKKDSSGAVINTVANAKEIQALAERGQGGFYYATFGGDYIKTLSEDLNRLEKSEFESSMMITYDEKFQIPLFCGLCLLLVTLAMNLRRRNFKFWRGRFEVPPA